MAIPRAAGDTCGDGAVVAEPFRVQLSVTEPVSKSITQCFNERLPFALVQSESKLQRESFRERLTVRISKSEFECFGKRISISVYFTLSECVSVYLNRTRQAALILAL